jgi:hypothetical protein
MASPNGKKEKRGHHAGRVGYFSAAGGPWREIYCGQFRPRKPQRAGVPRIAIRRYFTLGLRKRQRGELIENSKLKRRIFAQILCPPQLLIT